MQSMAQALTLLPSSGGRDDVALEGGCGAEWQTKVLCCQQ